MADTDKILKRLETEFEYVETYIIGKLDDPVWFACNMNTATFRVVGIYLDSEIGGYFTIDDAAQMQYVRDNFDAIKFKTVKLISWVTWIRKHFTND